MVIGGDNTQNFLFWKKILYQEKLKTIVKDKVVELLVCSYHKTIS